MPKSPQPLVPKDGAADGAQATLCDRADAMFRCAVECCRQHQRYARLVEAGAPEAEQRAALEVVRLCDRILGEMASAYERAAAHATGHTHDEWWHRANMLWLVSREAVLHNRRAEHASRDLRQHSPEKLAELAVEYDLEASAMMALGQAIGEYRKARPGAELGRPA